MTGGITSGVTYFGIARGSKVPPGKGAAETVITANPVSTSSSPPSITPILEK
jgi:hypothetical protein